MPGWPAMIAHNLAFLLKGAWLPGTSHLPPCSHEIPADFFGIHVASSPEPACDDFVRARLNDLGIRCVRVDLPTDGSAPHVRRFLDALIAAGFRILLHPVQPVAEAARMTESGAQADWRRFLAETLDAIGPAIERLEVGSTVNRRRWCGYTLSGFQAAWRIAWEECGRRQVPLAGPNVTDFEPFYNIGLLGILRTSGCLPSVHTTNLFAERATEPERFDPKIAGPWLAPLLRFNLIRKAAWLAAISRHYRIPLTFSTHAAWSLRRIDRILPNTGEKQADYLSRYCCLAAASGALDRIYWGPLIGQREGLIHDGTSEYPEIPHVTCYARVPGRVSDYTERPAFAALKTSVRFLANARYVTAHASTRGLEIHEFARDGRILHVAWTQNGRLASISACYEDVGMESVSYFSRDGLRLARPPDSIMESPVYMLWPVESRPILKPAPAVHSDLRVSVQRHMTYRPIGTGRWNGMYLRQVGEPGHLFRSLLPEELEAGGDKSVLRDRRNTVWSCPDPRDMSRSIVVKRRQTRNRFRMMIEFWKSSRGRKAWNSTHELLRRGIPTARPVAFFETKPPTISYTSYFIYEEFVTDFSARQVFTALAGGEPGFRGIPAESIYRQVADFVINLHNRGVFFRDLSAGNLLMRAAAGDGIEFCLIDTARARFHDRSLSLRLRIKDLVRLAHPLSWPCRNEFLSRYFERLGRPFTRWMRLPFALYDLKNAIKIRRRRPAPTPAPTPDPPPPA